MTKNFFSKERAENFAKSLEAQGIKTKITAALDGFNQRQYRVEW